MQLAGSANPSGFPPGCPVCLALVGSGKLVKLISDLHKKRRAIIGSNLIFDSPRKNKGQLRVNVMEVAWF